MTLEVSDPSTGLEGWVCIHALGRSGSSGGIRCVGDVTKDEVRLLAKAMTYKFSFFCIPQGGAKAGLRIDYDEEPARRVELIRAAARHLKPIVLRSNIWSPWTDMNFYGHDLSVFYREIGISYTPNKLYNSSQRTAISAAWSLEACLAFYGLDPQETTITIEGFGSVASYLAPFLKRARVRVVAASSSRGMVYNADGLDLDEVVARQRICGSAWVEQNGNWKSGPIDGLFDIPADVVVPCARVHSIDKHTAERIRARFVLPIANVPCTDEALQVLDRRGIEYMPDFVVNGGGVNGHVKDIGDPFGKHFKAMFGRMIETARLQGCPVRKIAEDAANTNYAAIVAEAYQTDALLLKVARAVARRRLIPKAFIKKLTGGQMELLHANVASLFI